MPVVVKTIACLRSQLHERTADATSARHGELRIALVPTMGALHDGHFALVARARALADIVVVSIFVNPLQFGKAEDLERYPRTVDSDVEKLSAHGVELVFAPTIDEMYPSGAAETRVSAGPLGALYEGRSRPGHFDGMLTVVAKLLNIVRPDVALFGEKDAQQVALVKRMVADLNVEVDIEVVEIVREKDGLALSSRNRFLDPGERQSARALSRALREAESSVNDGMHAVLSAAHNALAEESTVHLDYLSLVSPTTFLPVEQGYRGRAILLVAALVGTTRLIDNATFDLA